MMDLHDKKAWLNRHGQGINGGCYQDGAHYTIWVTHGGMEFKGVGFTHEELIDNLFRVVEETLFRTCR